MKKNRNRIIVYDANVKLHKSNLVIESFGNVSGRNKKIF